MAKVIRNRKTYFKLTLLISILLGVLLPLAMGVIDPTLIAIFFSSIWFFYIGITRIAFLIRPGLKIKAEKRRRGRVLIFDLLMSP